MGELLALRWDNVDLTTGKIHVCESVTRGVRGTPKPGRARDVPLSQPTLKTLREQRHLRGEQVFCDLDGKRLIRDQCVGPLARACGRAHLRNITWHQLRRTSSRRFSSTDLIRDHAVPCPTRTTPRSWMRSSLLESETCRPESDGSPDGVPYLRDRDDADAGSDHWSGTQDRAPCPRMVSLARGLLPWVGAGTHATSVLGAAWESRPPPTHRSAKRRIRKLRIHLT